MIAPAKRDLSVKRMLASLVAVMTRLVGKESFAKTMCARKAVVMTVPAKAETSASLNVAFHLSVATKRSVQVDKFVKKDAAKSVWMIPNVEPVRFVKTKVAMMDVAIMQVAPTVRFVTLTTNVVLIAWTAKHALTTKSVDRTNVVLVSRMQSVEPASFVRKVSVSKVAVANPKTVKTAKFATKTNAVPVTKTHPAPKVRSVKRESVRQAVVTTKDVAQVKCAIAPVSYAKVA